jgi:translation initiation factor IF-3
MGSITPDPKKRGYLLPPGCKDLIDVLKDTAPEVSHIRSVRVNGQIRASEVRVIGPQGQQLGIVLLNDALELARAAGLDLVEVAPDAKPPVCRLLDYGKYCPELSKKEEKRE